MEQLTRIFILICLMLTGNVVSGSYQQKYDIDADRLLQRYSTEFPEIHFINLYGEGGMVRARNLISDLGNGAYDMTYEHEDEIADTLITAQIHRIKMMIKNSASSSSIFHTGKFSNYPKSYLCVITFNEKYFNQDPYAATHLLVGNADIDTEKVLSNSVVNNWFFSEYTLHHEIFHCLDAYINGPTIHKTVNLLEHAYELYRAEQRADYYAAIMLRLSGKDATDELIKLANYRTLHLLDWDHTHYTAPIIKDVMRNTLERFYGLTLSELARTSSRLADEKVISRANHKKLIVAAYHVAIRNNVYEAVLSPEADELKHLTADQTSVARLEKNLRDARMVLQNGDL